MLETGSATVHDSCMLNGDSDANCSWKTISGNNNVVGETGPSQVPRVPIQVSFVVQYDHIERMPTCQYHLPD